MYNVVKRLNVEMLKHTHGRVLLLAGLQVKAYNFPKSSTPRWVFITFLEL